MTSIKDIAKFKGINYFRHRQQNYGRGHGIMRTKLANAIENGNLQAVFRLTSSKLDVNEQNEIGVTPLMRAARGGHFEIAERLLSLGADPDKQDSYGWSSLMHAAYNSKSKIIQLLLDVKADTTLVNKNDDTAFLIAYFHGDGKGCALLQKYEDKMVDEHKLDFSKRTTPKALIP